MKELGLEDLVVNNQHVVHVVVDVEHVLELRVLNDLGSGLGLGWMLKLPREDDLEDETTSGEKLLEAP